MKSEFDDLVGDFKLVEIFFRAEHMDLRGEILTLIDNASISDQQRIDFQAQALMNFDEIKTDLRRLDAKMVEELRENYEKKLQSWVEKIKKDNHDLWEESVKNATEGFKNLGLKEILYFNHC